MNKDMYIEMLEKRVEDLEENKKDVDFLSERLEQEEERADQEEERADYIANKIYTFIQIIREKADAYHKMSDYEEDETWKKIYSHKATELGCLVMTFEDEDLFNSMVKNWLKDD